MKLFVTLKLMTLRLEERDSSMIRDGTWNPGTSGRTDISNQMCSNALQQHLLDKLDSLIIQEKKQARERRTRRLAPYRLKTNPRKKKKISVPRDPDCPDGEWTEGELNNSSDSDIY
ncbi:ORF3 [Gimeltorquevirus ursid13]|uniref:ORF3 n=1 Tax=Giant panda anellovirus TaxID=2016460 RepID=A0A220IGH7_9VIRU|nr:ORF3 [Giant panda anellovirus]ASH99094.1 ORF3 [Giant panda anellovirus]